MDLEIIMIMKQKKELWTSHGQMDVNTLTLSAVFDAFFVLIVSTYYSQWSSLY